MSYDVATPTEARTYGGSLLDKVCTYDVTGTCTGTKTGLQFCLPFKKLVQKKLIVLIYQDPVASGCTLTANSHDCELVANKDGECSVWGLFVILLFKILGLVFPPGRGLRDFPSCLCFQGLVFSFP